MTSEAQIFDLFRATYRRAESIMTEWGCPENLSENARVCECFGWDDLADRWRSLIRERQRGAKNGPTTDRGDGGGISEPTPYPKGSGTKGNEEIQ